MCYLNIGSQYNTLIYICTKVVQVIYSIGYFDTKWYINIFVNLCY